MNDLKLEDLAVSVTAPGLRGLIDNLRGDLQSMDRFITAGDAIPFGIAQAIERQALTILDVVSPGIRRVVAEYERYRATPKIGER
jgi:hypothetical protein